MALAIVLVGILSGIAGVAVSIMAGLGIVVALLAYPVAGIAGMLCAAVLAALPALPVAFAQAPVEAGE